MQGIADYEFLAESHQDICRVNHSSSAGKMEVDAIPSMFLKSEEKFGVKCTTHTLVMVTQKLSKHHWMSILTYIK